MSRKINLPSYKDSRKKYFAALEDEVSKRLKKSRFRHTMGVAHTSACLAMKHGCDMDKAYTAGLLHDIAKNLSDDEMLKAAKRFKLKLSAFEKTHPYIIHGPVGSVIAREEFGIEDEDILNAIKGHTTGRAAMSLLEKIVFIADYMEAGRDTADNLDTIRPLAFEDIDKCMIKILRDTLSYLEASGSDIDDKTRITADYYISLEK